VWLPDNGFITEKNIVYGKPALIHDKQHYVWSENTLLDCPYLTGLFTGLSD